MLNDIGLELVQVSRLVTTRRQINLQTETLLALEAGPLGQNRKSIQSCTKHKDKIRST